MTPNIAKFRLYNKSPFFGSIIFNIPVEEDKEIGTMGTDGSKIFYSQKYWDSLNNNEKMGVLAHEIGHLYLRHLWRQGYRQEVAINPKTGQMVLLFNIAGDYVVNLIVKDELRLSLPGQCLYNPVYRNWSTEQVYNDLLKKIPKMTSKQLSEMIKNMLGNDKGWQKASPKQRKEMESKMKQLIQQALQHQKSKGDLPAYLKRAYEDLQPKEDWRNILMDYAQPYIDDYTFSPSDRRFLDEDFIIPDIKDGQQVNWIGVAIDSSGSISEQELNAFIGEIRGIMEAFDKVKVRLTFCDANAMPFIELDEYEPDKIRPVGGGGTDFDPPFKMVEQLKDNPLVMLYFTDLMGTFPKKNPEYDVIWIVPHNNNQEVPFGKVLPYKL